MGKPDAVTPHRSIIMIVRVPGEVKHLSTRRKRNQYGIPIVAASEMGEAQIATPRNAFYMIHVCESVK
jgi:hypothetical protein